MKAIIEFGVRGGAHSQFIAGSITDAAKLAAGIQCTLTNDPHSANPRIWHLLKYDTRKTWRSDTYFIAVSRLDGVMRGSASAALWRKPNAGEMTQDRILTS